MLWETRTLIHYAHFQHPVTELRTYEHRTVDWGCGDGVQ
jgi:hypothetical protein